MLLLLTFVALGTSLIWTGFAVIDFPTIIFALIALVARTLVLYPVLTQAHVTGRERRLIAFFGPRGLSSLLLTLLPVFAGVAGAERLFSITCLVVLCSVVVHGTGIAIFLRRNHIATVPAATDLATTPAPARAALPTVVEAASNEASDKITLEEALQLQASGEEVIFVDARAERNRRNSEVQVAGSIRIDPHEPVRDATAMRLSQRATLVVYCA
jgi:sodium/hydrogen antiporter